MGLFQQLTQAMTGSAPSNDDATLLLDAYRGCLARAAVLERDAAVAPGPGSRTDLLELARVEKDLAERLWEALVERGRDIRPPVEVPAPTPARSHWARLVEALEAHRAAVQHCRDLSIRLADASPATAAVFAALSQAQSRLCERLRGLIARADPQAID